MQQKTCFVTMKDNRESSNNSSSKIVFDDATKDRIVLLDEHFRFLKEYRPAGIIGHGENVVDKLATGSTCDWAYSYHLNMMKKMYKK